MALRIGHSRDTLKLEAYNRNKVEIKSKTADSELSLICDSMGQKKKEHKKPELQLYRPGMGLDRKNRLKSEECSLSLENLNLDNADTSLNRGRKKPCDVSDPSPVSNTSTRASTPNCLRDNIESKKSVRSRRPDLQVYTPKPRIAAKFPNTVDNVPAVTTTCEENDIKNAAHKSKISTSKKFSHEKSSHRRSPDIKEVHISSHTKQKALSDKSGHYKNAKLPHNKVSHEDVKCPQNAKSAVDVSVSRSTPDGFSEDYVPVNCEVIQFADKEIAKKDSSQKSNCPVSPQIKVVSQSYTHSKYSSWADCDPEENVQLSGYIQHRKMSNECDIKSIDKCEVSHDTKKSTSANNALDSKQRRNTRRNQERTTSCSSEGSSYRGHLESSNTSNNRNKRDKSDQHLPPRFQKQKAKSIADQQVCVDIKPPHSNNGILRVSASMLTHSTYQNSSDALYQSHIPPQYSPPAPQQFVPKQLFNPKNPNVPEIVNVPSYTLVNANLPPNEVFINPPLFAVPTQSSSGYIPPPQPLPPQSHFPRANYPLGLNGIRNSTATYVPAARHMPPVMCDGPQSIAPVSPGIRPPMYALPQENESRRLKPIVEKNLKEISLLERELTSKLAKGLSASDVNLLRQCRWKLQLRYENIILADPRYCAEKNAEQQLWKSAYYQIIEALRKNLEGQPENKELKENLLNIITEGTVFYENLLEKQQETYGFNLHQLLEMETLSMQCLPETLRLVLISSQKVLIHLGDLSRYREQANGTTNFGKARSLYLKAQQLAPKNGRPYHQLAVLALCAKRKLDAVYYFMRSLAASNPFLSAREYLLSLFEDAKKKYEQYEKKRLDDIANEMALISADVGERNEVWIKPDGSKIQRDSILELSKFELEFKKMSNVELNKRFVTSFLHVHGKLFTKVGMETFDEIVTQMLKEFYYLLQRSPFPLESSRLLQLFAINMFSVANTSHSDNSMNIHENSLFQVQALNICQSMMCLIMQRCSALHRHHVLSPEYPRQVISDDMAHLFSTVKVWTDWMSCQKESWPLCLSSLSRNLRLGITLDVWSSFAELLTVLKDVDCMSLEIINEHRDGYEQLVLDEDSTLLGFVPLLGALHDPTYVKPPYDKDRAKNIVRISRIQFFGDYLCGIPSPYLVFDVEHKQFNSVFSLSDKDASKSGSDLWDNGNKSNDDSFGDDSLESDESFLNNSLDEEGSSEMKTLWSKKEALCREKAQQEKQHARMQAVLRRNQTVNPIVLLIQPRYLIPDTNCFIDYLEELKELLTFQTYHLIVPLIVISELDGLARGAKDDSHSTPDHAGKVTAFSRAAVMFLEQEFANRNMYLRAITSKGSIMDTISFRVEEVARDKRGTNDDLILSCCMIYCQDRPEIYMNKRKDEPVQLTREVVLLTDDRNLRVKALTQNVPARDVESFLKWAKS